MSLRVQDKIVRGRERAETAYNSVSSLGAVAKLIAYNGLDRSDFIFQSVCKFFDGQLAKFLFVLKSLGKPAIAVCYPNNEQRSKKIDEYAFYLTGGPG